MTKDVVHDLTVLTRASRSLAEAETLDQIKSLRDKAEAVRQFAKSAALGLQVQNLAAGLKLRAERKAGGLLAQLSLRGGDRKSKSHRESLKLADIGIDRNKSARWQVEASIPESVFLAYLAAAEASGREITSQGLFRLAKKEAAPHRTRVRNPGGKRVNGERKSGRPAISTKRMSRMQHSATTPGVGLSKADDIITEMEHQRHLLAAILTPLCEDRQAALEVVCKRTVIRVLGEMQDLLAQLYAATS